MVKKVRFSYETRKFSGSSIRRPFHGNSLGHHSFTSGTPSSRTEQTTATTGMENAAAETPSESKLPTSPRSGSSPETRPSETTQPGQPAELTATPCPQTKKKSSKSREGSLTAETSHGESSSRTLPESRRRSSPRKRSTLGLSLSGLAPESSRHELYKPRKTSIPASLHPGRKGSRASLPHSEPSTITSRKMSPKSSVPSTPSTSPSEIPMRFMSIDLEKELPEIFSTSLNPTMQDPDMSEFYSRIKSPPPLYIGRKYSSTMPIPSHGIRKITRGTQVDPPTRYKLWLALFVFVFFVFPIGVIVVFRLIPAFLSFLDNKGFFMVGPQA